MSNIFDEKFERNPGYDENSPGWTESIGTGCTIDEDADPSGAGDPSGWGDRCLKVGQKAGQANYAYNQIGDAAIRSTKCEVVFTDLSNVTTDNDRFYLLYALNNALSTPCWYIRVEADSDDRPRLILATLLNGVDAIFTWGPYVEEDVVYKIEMMWDSTSDFVEWRVNGIRMALGALTSGHVEMGTIAFGHTFTTSTVDGEFYADVLLIDDADWHETLETRIFEETFEETTSPGYDNAGWSEDVGSGCTVDSDKATSGVTGTPASWGDDCLELIKTDDDDEDARTELKFPNESDLYAKFDIIINAEAMADTETTGFFILQDITETDMLLVCLLYQDGSGNRQFLIASYHDGSQNPYYSLNNISLDTRYTLEFKWDSTNNAWAWRIDGVDQPNDQDDSDPITSEGDLTSTHPTEIGFISFGTLAVTPGYTIYIDNIALDTDDWVGGDAGFAPFTYYQLHHR